MSKPPLSSLTAFLNALSLLSSSTTKNPDFDAGLNTSSAWTEAARNSRISTNINSLSDEESEDGDHSDDNAGLDGVIGRSARALYAFEGKPEFRELTSVQAGDELEVLKEEVGDGWSLVRCFAVDDRREIGLLPRSYYTFTADFAQAPDLELPPSPNRLRSQREASQSSITPRGSPSRTPEPRPIVPQNTGEWFPSFRRSLLGGKSFNRFSSFVTSGAEEWVLQGSGEEISPAPSHVRDSTTSSMGQDSESSRIGQGEADRHFVEAGPTWKSKSPPFRILVHSPSKRTSMLSSTYTVYAVTSLFDSDDVSGNDDPLYSPVRITVHRRFSHFVVLHTALSRRLPGIALPPLPEKQYAGRFNDDFIEARRGDLERYLGRVVRHPVARYAEVLTFFLGCESDNEWKSQYQIYLSLPPAGPSFYANVYHPAFNIDADDANETIDKFVTHTKAVGRGVQGLRNVYGAIRQASIEMSKAQRLLSYSLLSLITSKPLASAPTTGISEEDEEESSKAKGHINEDGAWCWREGCEECLKMTKGMQKTSEVLQTIADLYDNHARHSQLVTHESLKSVAHPSTLYADVVETHRSTLSRYKEATIRGSEDEDMAARCETVLNTTMAEIDTYHTQKCEDFTNLTMDILDDEIAFYEQIMSRLKNARRAFDQPQYDKLGTSPRQPSIYERELEHPRLEPPPITQPCPHVFDSAPMRPVSVAIQEGVGMLLGSPTRQSVFGKFW